jgi:ABC-type polar amino acid transport system, ATPase component
MKVFIHKAVKKYNNNVVLNIDNLNLENEKIYAVIGLNGSGKTTLMESIAGLRSLSSGNIKYNDLNLEEVRSDISIMLQSSYLFNGSVLSNIICGLKFRKYKDEEIKRRLAKYLTIFNIEELLNKNSKKLSGGEQEKVCLLRTAILETDLTIFDEPTSSMDIESTLKAEELIKNMAKEQRTVVVITHDIYQAKRIADEVIFMDRGKVIEIGKKEDIFNNPKHNLIKAILNM